MGPSGALAGRKAPGVRDGGLAGVQGEGGLAKGACRPGASTPTGRCAGPGPAQPATAVLCRHFHLPGRPRPDAAAPLPEAAPCTAGPSPSGTPPKPTRQAVLERRDHQDSGKGAGPRSRSQQVEEALSNPEPDQVRPPRATEPRAGPALPPNYNSQKAELRGRGRAVRTASVTSPAQPAAFPPSPAPRGVRALGRAQPDGNRGHPAVCPQRQRERVDYNSQRALRAGAR
ncbi:hypothetical protein VULLAG_LOCUS4166 [Vulpes lagopus]